MPKAQIPDSWRLALPAPLVRRLPARRRAKHFQARLRAGRLDELASLLGRSDPFDGSDALFHAVDHLMLTDQAWRLSELIALARNSEPFGARVWRLLCLWIEGHQGQAIAGLERMSTDEHQNDGFARRAASAWALYLRLPAFKPSAAPRALPLMQFWDAPEPPLDVAQEMRAWQDLAGENYIRLSMETARQFFLAEFGRTEAALFDRCPHPAVQSDLVRLGWLLVHGGIYVDADARMRPKFAALYPTIGDQTLFWFRTRSAKTSVLNGFLATPPDAQIVGDTFREACKRLSSGRKMHVFDYAGPSLCTQVVLEAARRGDLENTHAVSDGWVAEKVMRQINASYKSDKRNWRTWMKASGHVSV